MLNVAEVMPIPNARVMTTNAVRPALRRRLRIAKRTSCTSESRNAPVRESRTWIFTCSTPPSSMRAARCASAGVMPARIFSSTSISRWERTSWSRSASTRRVKNKLRRKLRAFTRSGMFGTSLRCFQCLADRQGNAAPALGLGFQLFLTRLREAVVFGAAIVLGFSPKCCNPIFFFHDEQRGKERAWLNHKSAAGELLDTARNSQSVHLAGAEGFQNQQVQSPLQ